MASDLKFALRALARSPGQVTLAILIAAIGIGAATAMFSTVNALVLRPLSLPDPDRLVAVHETHLERNLPQFAVSIPNYADWQARSRSWESLAAVSTRAMNLTGGDEPDLVQVSALTANFLPTLGIPISHGRGFLHEEDRPGGQPVAVISEAFWQQRMGGREDVLGEVLMLDGNPYTIVGVVAPRAPMPGGDFQIAIPLIADPSRESRMDHYLGVYGRLKAGVTLAQADAEMKALAAQIFAELPQEDRGWSTTLVPLAREIVDDGVRRGLHVLLGAVGLLLLISCANLSNLMLVRAAARTHENAVRTALGAGRWRIVRQQLVESLLLTAAGGAAGVLLALWAVEALQRLPLPRAGEITVDPLVLAVASTVTLLAGLLAGIGPALAASRVQPQAALPGRSPRGGHRSRLRDTMVVAQIALSFTLLIGTALLARSLWRLVQVDPGFNAEQVLTLSLRPSVNAAQFYERLCTEAALLPGVTGIGTISRLPLTPGSTQNEIYALPPAAIPPDRAVQANWRLINGDYFGTMQIPILQGRDFRELTPTEARQAIIISASLARTLFGDADPIGRRILRVNAVFTVIGVVGDVRSQQLGLDPMPAFYMSLHRFTYGPQQLVARIDGNATPVIAALREHVRRIDPTVPVFQVRMMADVRAESLRQERVLLVLVGGFAGIALLLATLGTYGVIAFTVQRRTAEIGIRLAIGAQAGDVLRLVLAQGARLAALGLATGLLAALTGAHVLAALLYETPSSDLFSYICAALALTGATFAATLIPARRATRIDPMIALRTE